MLHNSGHKRSKPSSESHQSKLNFIFCGKQNNLMTLKKNQTCKQQSENDLQQTATFFLSGFSFTDNDDSHDGRGREGTIFYSTLPLPPAHEYSGICLQLCM